MEEIKASEFPNKVFATRQELFLHLKANEAKLLSLKKATIKNSEGCNIAIDEKALDQIKDVDGLKDGFVYAVINTTNYMDSHNDVHLPKIWNKSLKEQKGKIFYVTDHDLKINSVIAFPSDVSMSVKNIKWTDLGKAYTGETQALIFEVSKDNIKHDGANKIIEEKIEIEHSVRMQYVDMFLAINSDEKEDKDYKKKFDKHINQIANKETAMEKGYFWGVGEAKISQEGSMVLMGSNDITPLLQGESKVEPLKDTQEPLKDTQKVAEDLRRYYI